MTNNLHLLAKLHSDCFPHKPWSQNDFAELKNSGCEIVFSENSFIVWRSVAGEAEIITLGVNPAHRRGGIASALLGMMENDLRKKDIKKIFLEVAQDNTAAINLYKKHGFSQIGIRPKYYDGIDAVNMEKIL